MFTKMGKLFRNILNEYLEAGYEKKSFECYYIRRIYKTTKDFPKNKMVGLVYVYESNFKDKKYRDQLSDDDIKVLDALQKKTPKEIASLSNGTSLMKLLLIKENLRATKKFKDAEQVSKALSQLQSYQGFLSKADLWSTRILTIVRFVSTILAIVILWKPLAFMLACILMSILTILGG